MSSWWSTDRRAIGVDGAIEALAVQATNAVELEQLGCGSPVPGRRRDPHAERLVDRQPLEALVLRLQQAVAGHPSERLSEVAGGKADEDELVLYAAQAQAHALGVDVDAERIAREVTEQLADLAFAERASRGPWLLGRLILEQNHHRPGTIGAERRQHAEAVGLAEPELAGDGGAHCPLRQQALEERGRLARLESVLAQGQGGREPRHRIAPVAPDRVLGIREAIAGGTGSLQRSNHLPPQEDRERPVTVHSILNFRPSAASTGETVSRRLVGLPLSI